MTEIGSEYELVVAGALGPRSLRAIGAVKLVDAGPAGTRLRGRFVDQSELHGILERIRDLGLELLEVRRIP